MSEAAIIDGKAFAATLRERVAAEVARIKDAHGLTPNLTVVLVGEDPASQVYVRNKGQQTQEAFPPEVSTVPLEQAQGRLEDRCRRVRIPEIGLLYAEKEFPNGIIRHAAGGHRGNDRSGAGTCVPRGDDLGFTQGRKETRMREKTEIP